MPTLPLQHPQAWARASSAGEGREGGWVIRPADAGGAVGARPPEGASAQHAPLAGRTAPPAAGAVRGETGGFRSSGRRQDDV